MSDLVISDTGPVETKPYTGKREFTCDAIAEVVQDPDHPYSWVIFLNGSGDGYTTKMSFFYQSKFPPYIHTYEGQYGTETVPCAYVDGEDSLVVTANYENNNTDGYNLESAYIRQCKAVISDQLNSSGTVGWATFECVISNGQDVLRVNSGYPNVTILSSGAHLGMKGFGAHMKLFKRTSSWSAPSTPTIRAVRYVTGVRAPSSAGYGYSTRSQSGVADYRLIQWKPFQSGAEWLAYCQAHSVQ